jgi:glycosyltransferase involved in cell wall biosynthesis
VERSSRNASNLFWPVAKPFFSIVIASTGRTASVVTLLESLLRQRFQHFEAIVVDQNGDDRLGPIMRRFQPTLALRRIRRTVQNASLARNAGARMAAGDWLVFADDDCYYHSETLSAAADVIGARHPQVLAGNVICPDGRKLSPWFQGRGPLNAMTVLTCLLESCLFFKRDSFLGLGGFDPEFGPGGRYHAAEGADLLYRFLRTHPHGEAWFDSSIYCFHPRKIPPYDDAALERARLYALGRGALAAAHPNLLNLTHLGLALVRNLAYAAVSSGKRRAYYISRIRASCEGFTQYGDRAFKA